MENQTLRRSDPKKLSHVHLAVYSQLMEWRRHMYEEQKEEGNTVLGIAGEAWTWATLTPGDLKFIASEVRKLESIIESPAAGRGNPVSTKVFSPQVASRVWNGKRNGGLA